MKKNLLFIVIFLFITYSFLFSQDDSLETKETTPVIKDTVCILYKFYKGDELTYRVTSRDSIVFGMDEPILRERVEKLRVYCDSVSSGGLFHLRLTLIDYSSTESSGEEKDITRTSSPWLNRNTYLVIDSVGNRIKVMPDNYHLAAISPGGAFAPYLFFAFEQNCKAINESWFVSGKDSLYENSVPAGEISHSNLLRLENNLDTLGYFCSQFRFVRTASGNFLMQGNEGTILNESVMNSGGVMMIAKREKVPVHLFQRNEEKLRVFLTADDLRTGLKVTNTNFDLISIVRNK